MALVETEFGGLEIRDSKKPAEDDEEYSDPDDSYDESDDPYILDTFEDDEGTVVEFTGCEDVNTPPDYEYFSDPEHEKTFRPYRKQFLESDGYDITTFCYAPFAYGLLSPITHEPGEFLYEGCVQAIQRLITYLREKKGRTLEFVKIVKANWVIDTLAFYFATFTAMEGGKLGTYQAKLFRTNDGSELEIFEFREATKMQADGQVGEQVFGYGA